MKDMWNTRYSEEGMAYGNLPNDFLAAAFHMIPSKGKVLCIAEGEGRNALFLAKKGYQVTAVDFSEVGMRKLKAFGQEQGLHIETIVQDLNDFDPGNEQWDAVVSIFAHLPPDIRVKLNQKLQQGLKDGGIYLLEAYRPEQLKHNTGGPSKVEMLVNLEIIHKELKHLNPMFEQETERDIHEGKYHNGVSSVVQFIGKK